MLIRLSFLYFVFVFFSIEFVNSNEIICNQFKLYDIHFNSDFDYKSISKLNEYRGLDRLKHVFKFKSGKYKVIRFILHINYLEVESDYPKLNDFYAIMMMKLDKKGMIIDAFYFPLSFAEQPANDYLYKLKNKIKFTNGMKLLDLNLISKTKDYYNPPKVLYFNKEFKDQIINKSNNEKLVNLTLDTNLSYNYSCVEW